jgi:hypothetical protein
LPNAPAYLPRSNSDEEKKILTLDLVVDCLMVFPIQNEMKREKNETNIFFEKNFFFSRFSFFTINHSFQRFNGQPQICATKLFQP